MTMKTDANAGWILFKSWEVKTAGELFGALVFCLALAFISESLGFLIWYLQQKEGKSCPVFIISFFYAILRLYNYLMMLLAMTYNIWIIFGLASFQALANFTFCLIKDRKLLKDPK